MVKNKYLLFSALLILFLFAIVGPVHAALEVKGYPDIPGLAKMGDNPTLPEYIAYWFGLLIYIAGAVSLISFVVGAVGLINPSVEAHGDAKDRMKGAILGLVLTLASFIIIKTINPALINLSVTPLPGGPGVYWYNDKKEKRPVSSPIEDMSKRGEDLIAGGFDKILYDCTGRGAGSGGAGPTLLFWEFKKPGMEANNDIYDKDAVFVGPLRCGDTLVMSGWGSFYWKEEIPGIYYCLNKCGKGTSCPGYMSYANTSSQDFIDSPFAGGIKGVTIVNDNAKSDYYGIIFHNSASGLGYGGFCNTPIINPGGNTDCFPVDKPDYTLAADIFVLNKEQGSSGNGVTFYSEDHGWNAGQQPGTAEITDKDIPFPSEGGAFNYDNPRPALGTGISSDAFQPDTDKFCFKYNGVVRPCEYMYKCKDSKCMSGSVFSRQAMLEKICGGNGCSPTACESFQDCPGSIMIKGSYLVGLYSDAINPASGKKDVYCQTFTKDVPNLKAEQFLGSGASKTDLKTIYIFATK